MKRILLIMLMLIISISLYSQNAIQPQGNGTVENPYQIANMENLYWIASNTANWNLHYIQTANINAAETSTWFSGLGWLAIGNNTTKFTGTYNGGGFTIDSLYINRPSTQYQGLFGYLLDAAICNLNIININIIGNSNTAGLAGRSNTSNIENIHVSGQLTSANTYTGGIIGFVYGGNLHYLSANVNISGASYVGGLCGKLDNSAGLLHSFSNGNVSGTSYVGGLCGYIYYSTTIISDCFSNSEVTGTSNVGGFVGSISSGLIQRCFSTGFINGSGSSFGGFAGSGSNVFYSYWDITSSGRTTSAGGSGVVGKSTEEMQLQGTFPQFNFNTLWQIDEGNSYPSFKDLTIYDFTAPALIELSTLEGSGTEEDPYIITNQNELHSIRQNLSAFYKLGNDIDLTNSLVWNFGRGWSNIGTSASTSTRFTGGFDGNGYKISGLHINRPYNTYKGFFGYTQNAVIRNIVFENADVQGNEYSGLLAGYSNNSTLGNIKLNGKVVSADNSVGGAIGHIKGGNFQNIEVDAVVFGYSNTGGFAGYLETGAQIHHCFSKGNVTGTEKVGGFGGYTSNIAPIPNISNCYSRASVSGTYRVGGFIGYKQDGYLSNSFSTGLVSGEGTYFGGFIGQGNSADNCYWNTETSGRTSSAGGSGVMGRTTEEMTFPYSENTYNLWDFDDIWREDYNYSMNDGYPHLPFLAPILLSPANNSQNIPVLPIFEWEESPGAVNYNLQVSANNDFDSLIINENITSNSFQTVTGLQENTQYFWRVNSNTGNFISDWSKVWNFFSSCPVISFSHTNLSKNVYGNSVVFDTIFVYNSGSTELEFSIESVETTRGIRQPPPDESRGYDNPDDYKDYLIRLSEMNLRDVPWLEVFPSSGTVEPNSELALIIAYNGNDLLYQIYSASLLITSNDPLNNIFIIPINLAKELENFTTIDNENNLYEGVPDGDIDEYLFNTSEIHPIEFNIFVLGDTLINPQLMLYIWDIDETSGQVDHVYFNDNFLGMLTGANDQWSTTVFAIPQNFLNLGQNNKNTVKILVDVNNTGNWATKIDWGQITSDNYISENAFIRYIQLDTNEYTPGDSVNITIEIDTELDEQQVRVETNVLDPAMINLDGISRELLVTGIEDEAFTEHLVLPPGSTPGIYYIQVIVYDLATNAINDIGIESFVCLGVAPPPPPVLVTPENGVYSLLPVSLVWEEANTAQTYHLQIATNPTFSDLIVNQNGIASTNFQTNILQLNTQYYWRVRGINDELTGFWSNTWAFTVIELTAPELVSPANNSTGVSTTPTFEWEAVEGTSIYYIQIALDQSFSYIELSLLSVTNSKTISLSEQLNNNTTYYWRVSASNDEQTSEWSEVWSFTTKLTAPILTLPENNSNNVSINPSFNWITVEGATQYYIEIALDPDFSDIVISNIIYNPPYQLSSDDLYYATTYYWRVKAANDIQVSEWSEIWNFTTIIQLLPPFLLSPVNNSIDVSIYPTLEWETVENANNYYIQIATDSDFSNIIFNTFQNNNSIVLNLIGLLSYNTTYYWRVSASNDEQTSEWSYVWNFTTELDPLPPPELVSPANNSTDLPLNPLLQWTIVENAEYYGLQISTEPEFTNLILNIIPDFNYFQIDLFDNLNLNTTYYWRANAYNDLLSLVSQWSEVWNFTTLSLPVLEAPELDNPLNNSTGISITPIFEWSYVENVSNYYLQVSTDAEFTDIVDFRIIEASVQFFHLPQNSALIYNTIYYWRVRAGNEEQLSEWSEIWNFTTEPEPLPAPELVSPPNNSTAVALTPTFVWEAVDNAEWYDVDIAADPDFQNMVLSIYTSSTSVMFPADTNLNNNTTYYWRVYAGNDEQMSEWSEVWSFTTELPPPLPAPELVSPPNNSSDISLTPLLEWSNVENVNYYVLKVSDNANFINYIIMEMAYVNSYQIQENLLNFNTTYYWRVLATDEYGQDSEWSEVWNFTTEQEPLQAPDLIAPINNSINVSIPTLFQWENVEQAESYQINVATDLEFQELTISVNVFSNSFIAGDIFSLDYATYYYWRVKAANDEEISEWSEVWSFTTELPPPLPAPELVSPPNNSSDISLTPLLEWSNVENVNYYVLQVSDNANFTNFTIMEIAYENSYQIQENLLNFNTTYYWRVLTADVYGQDSEWSEVWNFTTEQEPLQAPELIAPINNSINVSIPTFFQWENVEQAESYQINVATDLEFQELTISVTVFSNSFIAGDIFSLDYATYYYWRVKAANDEEISEWSEVWNFTTELPPPLPAPELVFPPNNSTDISLTPLLEWSNVENVNYYVLKVSDNANFINYIIMEMAYENSYQIQENLLNFNTTYYWRVLTADVYGQDSEWSEVWNFTTEQEPLQAPELVSPPNNSTAVALTPTFVWEAVDNAEWYDVDIAADPDFQNMVLSIYTSSTSVMFPADTNLNNNTTYYWRVYAGNDEQMSEWSEVWNLTTEDSLTQFIIELVEGWNAISSDVIPLNPDIEVIFSNIEGLNIVKNGAGEVYNPAQGINQIGEWQFPLGYLVHISASTVLNIIGYRVPNENRQIQLQAGWNLVSCLSQQNYIDIEEALISIEEFVTLVKSNDGRNYSPIWKIKKLSSMWHGEAYWILVTEDCVLTFPNSE